MTGEAKPMSAEDRFAPIRGNVRAYLSNGEAFWERTLCPDGMVVIASQAIAACDLHAAAAVAPLERELRALRRRSTWLGEPSAKIIERAEKAETERDEARAGEARLLDALAKARDLISEHFTGKPSGGSARLRHEEVLVEVEAALAPKEAP